MWGSVLVLGLHICILVFLQHNLFFCCHKCLHGLGFFIEWLFCSFFRLYISFTIKCYHYIAWWRFSRSWNVVQFCPSLFYLSIVVFIVRNLAGQIDIYLERIFIIVMKKKRTYTSLSGLQDKFVNFEKFLELFFF